MTWIASIAAIADPQDLYQTAAWNRRFSAPLGTRAEIGGISHYRRRLVLYIGGEKTKSEPIAPWLASGKTQVKMAEGMGLTSNLLWAGNELKSLSSTRAPRDFSAIGMTLDGGADAVDRHHLIW